MAGSKIFDGDLVLIKKQEEFTNGQISAVLINDEATLKRIKMVDNKLILYPDNPAYESMIITKGQVKIIGKAVKVVRYL